MSLATSVSPQSFKNAAGTSSLSGSVRPRTPRNYRKFSISASWTAQVLIKLPGNLAARWCPATPAFNRPNVEHAATGRWHTICRPHLNGRRCRETAPVVGSVGVWFVNPGTSHRSRRGAVSRRSDGSSTTRTGCRHSADRAPHDLVYCGRRSAAAARSGPPAARRRASPSPDQAAAGVTSAAIFPPSSASARARS
jgi:hypothetical protein